MRVLICDDQPPFRTAARMVVEMTEGFDVVGEADTGEGAVELARQLRPDLVLMDVNLPGIDGLEATRQVLVGSAGTVVVVLSTYEPEDYAGRARVAGAVGYIPKDAFGPEALVAVWQEAVA